MLGQLKRVDGGRELELCGPQLDLLIMVLFEIFHWSGLDKLDPVKKEAQNLGVVCYSLLRQRDAKVEQSDVGRVYSRTS